MTRLSAWVVAALWFALLASGGGVSAAARTPRAATVPAAPAVVIVAPAKPTAADLESETYADWAEYLNAFAATRPKEVALVRMTAVRWGQVAVRPALTDSYATIFVRRDGAALVHQGMVMEADAYAAGATWAKGGDAAPAVAYGFTVSRLERRR